MALQSHIGLQNIPDTPKLSWKKIASINTTPYSAVLLEHPIQARNILLVSGDARAVLHHCLLSSNDRHQLEKQFSVSESLGIFPIGIAMKHMHTSSLSQKDINEMTFIGAADTVFDTVPKTHSIIRKLRDKKIQVKIVSPMALRLSQAIVRGTGMVAAEDACITGSALSLMSDNELRMYAPRVNIFSELEFADEQRIARIFKEGGHRIIQYEFLRA